MGSPANEAGRSQKERQHTVVLTPFEVMDAAVTQLAYARVVHKNPSKFQEAKYCPESFMELEIAGKKIPMCKDYPVESVSWDEVNREFIQALNELSSDYIYGLPTEAQLEFIFRGGSQTAYVSGEDPSRLGEFVWYNANSTGPSSELQTHSVKSKNPNPFGVYRSSVWEWTRDWYAEYPITTEDYVVDPLGAPHGSSRVIRGGSSHCGAIFCRSANRSKAGPGDRAGNLGFRLSRTPRSF